MRGLKRRDRSIAKRSGRSLSGPSAITVGASLLAAVLLLVSGCGDRTTLGRESATPTSAPDQVYSTTTAAAATTTYGAAGRTPSDGAGGTPNTTLFLGEGGLSVAESSLDKKIISNASMQIEVEKGKFQTAFERALLLADKYGGYVVASQSSATGDDSIVRSGTIALRIPDQSFNQVLADAAKLGTLKSRNVDSQDVTEEYVDLQARLTNAESQERALLELMTRAKTVDEILQVRQVLSSTQQEIEQYRGRLRYLDEHTSYSTLELSLFEPGIEPTATAGGWGFVQALKDALHGFVDTINQLIVFLGGAVPVLAILALLAYVAYRIVRASTRKRDRERAQAAQAYQAQYGYPPVAQPPVQTAPAASPATAPGCRPPRAKRRKPGCRARRRVRSRVAGVEYQPRIPADRQVARRVACSTSRLHGQSRPVRAHVARTGRHVFRGSGVYTSVSAPVRPCATTEYAPLLRQRGRGRLDRRR